MNIGNKSQTTQQDYMIFSQNYTSRQTNKDHISTLLNKENKLQNIIAAVELNRTAVVDQRRQMQKDHYQSHREFGRDLSNNHNQTSTLSAKIANPISSTTNQASNVSLFKNFIAQYQSHNNAASSKISPLTSQFTKLELNNLTNTSQNYPSSRGQ